MNSYRIRYDPPFVIFSTLFNPSSRDESYYYLNKQSRISTVQIQSRNFLPFLETEGSLAHDTSWLMDHFLYHTTDA